MAKKSKRRTWTAVDAHLESRRREKEDTSIEHCPILKTNRRGYSAKGVQPGAVPQLSRLMLGLFGPRS